MGTRFLGPTPNPVAFQPPAGWRSGACSSPLRASNRPTGERAAVWAHSVCMLPLDALAMRLAGVGTLQAAAPPRRAPSCHHRPRCSHRWPATFDSCMPSDFASQCCRHAQGAADLETSRQQAAAEASMQHNGGMKEQGSAVKSGRRTYTDVQVSGKVRRRKARAGERGGKDQQQPTGAKDATCKMQLVTTQF